MSVLAPALPTSLRSDIEPVPVDRGGCAAAEVV